MPSAVFVFAAGCPLGPTGTPERMALDLLKGGEHQEDCRQRLLQHARCALLHTIRSVGLL